MIFQRIRNLELNNWARINVHTEILQLWFSLVFIIIGPGFQIYLLIIGMLVFRIFYHFFITFIVFRLLEMCHFLIKCSFPFSSKGFFKDVTAFSLVDIFFLVDQVLGVVEHGLALLGTFLISLQDQSQDHNERSGTRRRDPRSRIRIRIRVRIKDQDQGSIIKIEVEVC